MTLALLITHRADFFTVDRVAEELERRGVEALRLDSDSFPAQLELELCFPEGSGPPRPVLTLASRTVEANEVAAIWCRRLWDPPAPEGLEGQLAATCVRESIAARDAWLAGFEGRAVRWIDHPSRQRAANNKARQLAAARACGLATPPTLITNRPEAARAFWHAHGGDVIAKMSTGYGPKTNATRVFTNRVTEADLDGLAGLRASPMVFQRRIDKSHELRVIVVGDRVFAGSVDARGSAGEIDWRRAPTQDIAWRRAEVPEALARRLVAVNQRLGLSYGAADVIIESDGRPVFLEVNPTGEWGMIERDAGEPIAAAIAESLLAAPAPGARRDAP